ncbi:HNH endonuclease [Chryseobacterium sp. T20]|uniref:HNH endonuclease n=1 Tax=Chryseobacterium sp. T20 TaxID=3395375 RepID=UPI0039BC7D58
MTANLDALISREDFEIKDFNQIPAQNLPALQVRDLESGSFLFQTLRKPDFQRETSEWTPDKICDLIQSFLEGDLIPAVIFWNSAGYNFVIDGAHRLSAIIAWVTDDYGDGVISQSFFEYNIPPEQLAIAEKTRKLIKKKFGAYSDHKYAITNTDKVSPEMLERAKKLATLTIQLQWVRGDSSKAEASFFKINEQASPINDTEKKLLKSRKKPNSIAARAIIRSGTGHKYWSKFDNENQLEIETLAKDINNLLFTPKLETPIKTLDVPLAGKGYSPQTLSLVLDLINITNEIKNETDLDDDLTGLDTINILKRTKKRLSRITGVHPSSLGLHPAIYFYSSTGRYQVTAFYTILNLMQHLEKKTDGFIKFTNIRSDFENFLVSYKSIVNQTSQKFGSGLKSYRKLTTLFSIIIESLEQKKTEKEILKIINDNTEFNYIIPEKLDYDSSLRKEFTTEVKSGVFIINALKNPVRCKLCNSLIHKNSISIDHINRKEDGGLGIIDNGQLSHPFCNTTYKN